MIINMALEKGILHVIIWKEFSRVPDFFILTKHGYYFNGSQTQA